MKPRLNRPTYRESSTRAERDADIVASYRQHVRMNLTRSAEFLREKYPDLLRGIRPVDILSDWVKGIA